MEEQILFVIERHGLKFEIVEGVEGAIGSRMVRVRVSGESDSAIVDFTPDQCDVLGTMGNLARAREKVLLSMQEKVFVYNKSAAEAAHG